MRYRETQYEDSQLSNEKGVATIYLLMFIAIVAMGAPNQAVEPMKAEAAAYETR